MALFYFLSILAFSTVVGIPLYLLGRKLVRRRRGNRTNTVLLAIRIPLAPLASPELPRSERSGSARGETPDFKTDAEKFEDFLKRLASFHNQSALEVSMAGIGGDVRFHVSVPRVFTPAVKEEVYLLWPGARVEIAHGNPEIFISGGISLAGYLLQKKDHLFSIQTHRMLYSDPMASILEVFSRIRKIGEGAGIQIVLRPISEEHKKSIARSFLAIARGELGEIVMRDTLLSAENIPSVGVEIEERKKREKIKKDILNLAERKLSQPIFEANVRVCVSAGTKFRAQDLLDEIATSFSRFGSPHHNGFKFVKPANSERILEHFVACRFSPAETVVLSSEEIASFYHFPSSVPRTIGKKLWAKHLPVPSGFPAQGVYLGENEFHEGKSPVFLSNERGARHLYITGEKGTGKSTLIGNMLLQDIGRGEGVALIEPRGALLQRILGRIPPERTHDVLYLAMGEAARVPGIDALQLNYGSAEEKNRLARELAGIVTKFFTLETRGIMFDEYIQNAIWLLLESTAKNISILDVPRVLVDKKYRARLLSGSKNNELAHFWEHEAMSSRGAAALLGIAPYVVSRFEKFASSGHLRFIFQDPASAVDIESAVAAGKIIFVDLCEDKIGKENSEFIGMLLANKILRAAREGRKEKKRFNIYFDDCGGYLPDSVAKAISGSEGQNMNLALATRSVGELSVRTREAILKHMVSRIVFRVNPEDAEIFASDFGPWLLKHDFLNVDDLNAYGRIVVRGELSAPFSIEISTDSWGIGNAKIAHKIKEHSHSAHYRDILELVKKARERNW